MKTTTNINRMKSISAVVFSLLFYAVSLNANDSVPVSDKNASLEEFMKRTEESVRYAAPTDVETATMEVVMEELDNFMAETFQSLEYKAPVTEEATNEGDEMDKLDSYFAGVENNLKYAAPAPEAGIEIESLDMLADAIDASLKYKAPVVYEEQNMPTEGYDGSDEILANTNR